MRSAFLLAGSITAAMLLATAAVAKPARSPEQVAAAALAKAPVWDGHNDVPIQLRERRKNVLGDFDFTDTTGTANPATGEAAMQTDLRRLRAGKVGAQFWSVFVSPNLSDPQAVQATLEQIDVTKRMVTRHMVDLTLCLDTACVEAAWKKGRIASLIGIEGGHSIGGSLAVLRQFYELGARYMTLTHFKNNDWADSATDAPVHNGLSPLGKDVVREMQRLGMLVDLSHVSEKTMLDVLEIAVAPVMVSHSNAFAVNHHPRNVPDRVLDAIRSNGGIIMVNFYPPYVVEAARLWSANRDAEEARQKSLLRGQPDKIKAAMAEWDKANPMPRGSVKDVADHLDYIAKRIGPEHVGLGGDLDGIETTVVGMEDASTYPALFVELARRGWSQQDLEKLASRNMLRVLKSAEEYASTQRDISPFENPVGF